MATRKLRVTSVFVLLVGTLSIGGLLAPGASAGDAGDLIVEIVNQPADANANELITAAAHDPTGGDAGFVQVSVRREVYEGSEAVPNAEVTFELATGEGLATGTLNVVSRSTNSDGIATFGPGDDTDNPLSIADANQPFTTDYELIPVATIDGDYEHSDGGDGTESVEGAPSDPFDIWEAGCLGAGCNVTVRNGNDSYTALEDVGLGVSVVPAGSTEITCPNQRLIFASSVFFHTTTGDGTDVVSLVTHITRNRLGSAEQRPEVHRVVPRAQVGCSLDAERCPVPDSGHRRANVLRCIGAGVPQAWEGGGIRLRPMHPEPIERRRRGQDPQRLRTRRGPAPPDLILRASPLALTP